MERGQVRWNLLECDWRCVRREMRASSNLQVSVQHTLSKQASRPPATTVCRLQSLCCLATSLLVWLIKCASVQLVRACVGVLLHAVQRVANWPEGWREQETRCAWRHWMLCSCVFLMAGAGVGGCRTELCRTYASRNAARRSAHWSPAVTVGSMARMAAVGASPGQSGWHGRSGLESAACKYMSWVLLWRLVCVGKVANVGA